MTNRNVEILAIGAGPANLALAVAVEEMAPAQLSSRMLVLERAAGISWQPGMLLPEAQSQVSFIKDLVTLRNPQSRFSFVNYLHSAGRLNDFINMGSFVPYRLELSGYFQWVADSLARVQIQYDSTCVAIEPTRAANGEVTGWIVRLGDGSSITSRYLVIGAGRDPHIPDVFAGLGEDRIIHSTQYLQRITDRPRPEQCRVAVIGGAQSAAEMFHAVQSDLPGSRPIMIMRSIGLNAYESSKFTNELFYPSFVDEFFHASPQAREQMLAQMHRTNYAGLSPAMLDTLYRQLYLDRLSGQNRLTMMTMADVVKAREDNGEVVLTIQDRRDESVTRLPVDLVLLGTGFRRQMPLMTRQLAAQLGLERIEVTRHYRLIGEHPSTAACYLQGVNEATHGIADSLLSVLAVRAQEIAQDILEHRGQAPETGADLEQIEHLDLGPVAIS